MGDLTDIVKKLKKDSVEEVKSYVPLLELDCLVYGTISISDMDIPKDDDDAQIRFSADAADGLVNFNGWNKINGMKQVYVGPNDSEVRKDYQKDIDAYNSIRTIVKKEYIETGEFMKTVYPIGGMLEFLSNKKVDMPLSRLAYLAERMVEDFHDSYHPKTLGGQDTEPALLVLEEDVSDKRHEAFNSMVDVEDYVPKINGNGDELDKKYEDLLTDKIDKMKKKMKKFKSKKSNTNPETFLH